jgi:hypothetical protein
VLDQGIRDQPQRLHRVFAEPLDVLLVLHLILVVEDEEGLSIRISHVPKLEGQATLAWEFLLCPHKCQLRKVGPLSRRLRHVVL